MWRFLRKADSHHPRSPVLMIAALRYAIHEGKLFMLLHSKSSLFSDIILSDGGIRTVQSDTQSMAPSVRGCVCNCRDGTGTGKFSIILGSSTPFMRTEIIICFNNCCNLLVCWKSILSLSWLRFRCFAFAIVVALSNGLHQTFCSPDSNLMNSSNTSPDGLLFWLLLYNMPQNHFHKLWC